MAMARGGDPMNADKADKTGKANNDLYRTVAGPGRFELKVERSLFIAQARRAETEDEARAFVADVRGEHRDATHNCFAWRIGHDKAKAPSEYVNDHGEPAGTAGRPILGAITRLDLTDAAVVVTRYFGGKKLGVRGLIDAYGQAATGALAAAGSVTLEIRARALVRVSYRGYDTLMHRLDKRGARVDSSSFATEVELIISAPAAKLPGLVAELQADRLVQSVGPVDELNGDLDGDLNP